MPVGGTAIARALEAGRALLERDPLSKHHRRVMVLVTDGEDLQGDPVSVAAAAREQGITIYVVQIGGRTPEPLPDVTAAGEFRGYRTDESGLPMTTSLTAEGEAQLTQIAESTGGRIVQSQRGETGIREVAHALRQLMTEELSERVETVYANVFMYPLGAALLLLVIECFIGETPRRAKPTMVPPPRKARRPKKARGPATTALGLCLLLLALVGCRSVDKLFERHVPVVDEAIAALDAGDARAAAGLLEEYLSTGKCDQGNIGAPDGLTERANASFDLGLALFSIGESFGKRFGEEPGVDAGADPAAQAAASARSEQVDCALRIVRIIAQASSTPPELKARAYYLAGNLEFLRHRYQAAVEQYDLALRWIPGMEDGGDGTGRDAAHNRAIALERLERQQEPPDAGADASPDASAGDSGSDSGQNDGGPETPDASDDPSAKPDGGRPDGSEQQQKDPPKPNDQEQKRPEQQAQGEPSKSQDDRILDMLEAAPSLQQEAQKRQGAQRGHLGMEDK
jgi:tetratricopeptide (TPR) repeat protein